MRRPERLAEILREEITEIVGYELDDPRLLSVTVTDVRVSDNLRDAKVFVMIEGSEKEIKEALKALQHAATFIRQQVTLNLDLRHAPQFHFRARHSRRKRLAHRRSYSGISTKG